MSKSCTKVLIKTRVTYLLLVMRDGSFLFNRNEYHVTTYGISHIHNLEFEISCKICLEIG